MRAAPTICFLVGLVSAGAVLRGGAALAQTPARGETLRRFALIVGNNEGGEDTRSLRYAGDDARKLHAVLTELGGVRREDATLLIDGTATEMWNALSGLEGRVQDARSRGQRTAIVVYYSGHAKDGALRLGKTRLPMDAVRYRLASESRADVRIAIFDACRSGVVNRTKGARKGPAFEVAAEGAPDAQGMVFWSSSSADEDAQESDALGGSYFSHHLVSGLRGSADRSGDRRVTLSEAYEYAYARTVAETAETAAGAQHPTFSYDLKGNGNLVLAELGLGREGLYIPATAPAGIYYLVDAGRGVVSAEVIKAVAVDRVVALPPGRYKVKRRLADRLRIGDVRIDTGRFFTLDETRLTDASFADDPVKGGRAEAGVRVGLSVGGGMQAFFDAPTREGLFPPTGLFAAELSLRHFFRRDWIWAFDLALGQSEGTLVREAVGATLPFRFRELGAGSSLLAEWTLGDRLVPFVGGRLAFLLMSREFRGTGDTIPSQHLSTFSPGLVGGLHYRLWDDLHATLRGRVHYLHYNIDENRSLGYWELGAMLAYQLGGTR
ncbi:MAG TPA: caspase family protein [Polyangia bacterium]